MARAAYAARTGRRNVAVMWDEFMRRHGYDRYAAQGGDVGAGVTGVLGGVAPNRVVATHINGPTPFLSGYSLDVEAFTGNDRVRAERFNQWLRDGTGDLHLQATRPQTIGFSLTDSPTGLLAWIVEKFREWTDPAAELPEDAVDRDRLLANVSRCWFTRSGASSAGIVYEGMQAYRACVEQSSNGGETGDAQEASMVPQGVAVFSATVFAVISIRMAGRTTGQRSIEVVTSRRWRPQFGLWVTTGRMSGPIASQPGPESWGSDGGDTPGVPRVPEEITCTDRRPRNQC